MNKIAASAIVVLLVTVLTKIAGFIKEMVLAATLGAGVYSDAFIVALTIPTVLIAGISAAVGAVYLPIYTQLQSEKQDEEKAFNSNCITILFFIGLILSVVFLCFPEMFVKLFAVGFDEKTFLLTVQLSKIMMLSTIPMLISGVLISYLQLKGKFFITSIVSAIVSVALIPAFLIVNPSNFSLLGYTVLIANFTSLAVLAFSCFKSGMKYRFYLNLKADYLKQTGKLVALVFISSIAYQINTIIDKSFASALQEGTISALNYANRLNSFILGVLVYALITVLFPQLSLLSSTNDTIKIKEYLNSAIHFICMLILPICAGTIVLAKPIITLLFARGSFNSAAIMLTSESLAFYAIGFIGFNLSPLLSKVFLALKDTKTPALASIATVSINIALNFALVKPLAHKGLALATSLSVLFQVIILLWYLSKKLNGINIYAMLRELFKMLISTSIMMVSIIVINKFFANAVPPKTIYLAIFVSINVLTGAVIYFSLLYLMKVNVFLKTMQTILNQLRLKK